MRNTADKPKNVFVICKNVITSATYNGACVLSLSCTLSQTRLARQAKPVDVAFLLH